MGNRSNTDTFYPGVLRPDQSRWYKLAACLILCASAFFGTAVLYGVLLALLLGERVVALVSFFAVKRKQLATLGLHPSGKQNPRIFAIEAIWGACFALCVVLRFLPGGQRLIIWLSACAFLLDTIFMYIGCPFRKFCMSNRCCATCRIYHWNYPMLVTGIILLPSVRGEIWMLALGGIAAALSILLMVLWEAEYLRHHIPPGDAQALAALQCKPGAQCAACANSRSRRKGF